MEKVALHEIGYNIGLEHCEYDKKCMMNDAKVTIKQVDAEKYGFVKNARIKFDINLI